jgi:hypothetical protein
LKRERSEFLAADPHFAECAALHAGRRCRQASIRGAAGPQRAAYLSSPRRSRRRGQNLLRTLLAASRASTRSHVLPPRQSVNITRAIPYDKKLFYDLRNSLPLALFECPTKTLPKIAKKSDEMIVDRVISPECTLSGPRAALTLKKH